MGGFFEGGVGGGLWNCRKFGIVVAFCCVCITLS